MPELTIPDLLDAAYPFLLDAMGTHFLRLVPLSSHRQLGGELIPAYLACEDACVDLVVSTFLASLRSGLTTSSV